MSKSKGNIVRTETILDAFGTEVYKKQFPRQHQARTKTSSPPTSLRYFLLREVPFGQDGSFSFEAMITRYNADLANGYGNLVSRTLSMLFKYFLGNLVQDESDQDERSDKDASQTIRELSLFAPLHHRHNVRRSCTL